MKPLRTLNMTKVGRKFNRTFGIPIKQFYTDLSLGFDIVKFDDWIRTNVKAYDEKESLQSFIGHRYGSDASKLVASLMGPDFPVD